jgi:hypothetical protein
MSGTTDIDTIHGALGWAYSNGLTLRDVLSIFDNAPEVKTAADFDAAVAALVDLRKVSK